MKIALFIVTYKNDDMLCRCLDSITLPNEIEDGDTMDIVILNNYEKLCLDQKYFDRFSVNNVSIKVIDNLARPAFSTGHLSRSWNQCILHGFKDVTHPDHDFLILCQNDVVFKPGFIREIKNHLPTYDFITFGTGDELQIMTPQSVKTIGLYDERFCNIGFQEADYFLRAVLLCKRRCSINDNHHKRIHNPLPNNVIENVQCGHMRNDEEHLKSAFYHDISKQVFVYKWTGFLPFPVGDTSDWTKCSHHPFEEWNDYVKSIHTCPKQYIMYPYFECKLPDLGRKYINYSLLYK
jgi:hypothetical protein